MEIIITTSILLYFIVSTFMFSMSYVLYELKGWNLKEFYLTDFEDLTTIGIITRRILFLGGFLVRTLLSLLRKIFYKEIR